MSLITPAEVSTIAFVDALDPIHILPEFINSAEIKYVVPVVTQPVIDYMLEILGGEPGDSSVLYNTYYVLHNDYIKPYEAFCVKFMFYNQLLTEMGLFATSNDQREAALMEILSIMNIRRNELLIYMGENNIGNGVIIVGGGNTTRVSGISVSGGIRPPGTSSPNTDVTSVLNAASVGVVSDTDYLVFLNKQTGLLQRTPFSVIKSMIVSAGENIQLTGERKTGVDSGETGQISITDDYCYCCVVGGMAGTAVWKKFILFQT